MYFLAPLSLRRADEDWESASRLADGIQTALQAVRSYIMAL